MKIGLVAGESSGDVLGAGLIEAIRAEIPDASFAGVAGPAMLAAGCEQWEPAESLAVMGLVEPLAHIPRLLKLRRSLLQRWNAAPPDVFVGIDAPDFNLGLEQRLRQRGVTTTHYVSPSVWAWRAGRIKKIAKAADRVLCILPFEKSLYDQHGIDAVFVGHPKADEAPAQVDVARARAEAGCGTGPVVAVLPGSRRGEVERLGGILAASAARLAAAHPDIQFVTPIATPSLRDIFSGQLAAASVSDRFVLLDGQSQLAMAAADVVLLASGTAALEAALLGKPTVAAYRVARLTELLVRGLNLVKLQHFTLPNLLTAEPLIPEFIQDAAQPVPIADAVSVLLDDADRRNVISNEFAKLRETLAQNADRSAARAVIDLATPQKPHATR